MEECASIVMHANNDPLGEKFAALTDILSIDGCINSSSAAGLFQARYNPGYNHDYYNCHEKLGEKKNKSDNLPTKWGTFHQLHDKLQDFLLSCCQKTSQAPWKGFADSIECQH